MREGERDVKSWRGGRGRKIGGRGRKRENEGGKVYLDQLWEDHPKMAVELGWNVICLKVKELQV